MMKTTLQWAAVLLILVQRSHQRSSPESDSYVAAVVEFSPTDPKTPDEPPTNANAARYVDFVESAAKQNADIIVFPEVALTSINLPEREKWDSWTTIIPPPGRNYNPCIHSNIPVSQALRTISCSAREQKIYVVINIAEKVICNNETCPTDQRLYHNTNVVFDREGKIIARYRKYNLFREPQINITAVPEVVTFDTDFGVTFGTFICADILYKNPALYLTRMLNVTDIVYPVAWFTSLPFATPLQIQAGWSFAEDVNLLASGYNRVNFGNAGTGIYLGRQGIGKAVMPQTTTSELLIMQVPKKNRTSSARPVYSYSEEEAREPVQEKHRVVHDELRRRRSVAAEDDGERFEKQDKEDKFMIYQDFLSEYKSIALHNNASITQALCDGDFCCDFNVELANFDPSSKYRLVVFDGTTVYQEPNVVGIRVCAVVICSNDTVASCVNLQQSETSFSSITINATYPNYEDVLALPSSVGANLYPLGNWTYEERYENEKVVHVTTSLVGPTKNILTFGLYTRDFSRDGPTANRPSINGMQWATLTALAIVSLFLLFLYRKGWRKPWHTDNQLSSDAGPYQQLRGL